VNQEGDRLQGRSPSLSRPTVAVDATVGPVILYHGTTLEAWLLIHRDGLVPHRAPGRDMTVVWASDDPNVARFYARGGVWTSPSTAGVVLAFPAPEDAQIVRDAAHPRLWTCPTLIPAESISVHETIPAAECGSAFGDLGAQVKALASAFHAATALVAATKTKIPSNTGAPT